MEDGEAMSCGMEEEEKEEEVKEEEEEEEEEFCVEHFRQPLAPQLLRRGQGTHDPPAAQKHKHQA